MVLKILVDLADKLDALGYTEEANQIDKMIKTAEFLDLLKSRGDNQKPENEQ